jgi:hypothetical protein
MVRSIQMMVAGDRASSRSGSTPLSVMVSCGPEPLSDRVGRSGLCSSRATTPSIVRFAALSWAVGRLGQLSQRGVRRARRTAAEHRSDRAERHRCGDASSSADHSVAPLVSAPVERVDREPRSAPDEGAKSYGLSIHQRPAARMIGVVSTQITSAWRR